MSLLLLKVGDKVRITTDLAQLNKYMYLYSGKEATIMYIGEQTSNGGQIAKLDIDNGYWDWSYMDKLEQIYNI